MLDRQPVLEPADPQPGVVEIDLVTAQADRLADAQTMAKHHQHEQVIADPAVILIDQLKEVYIDGELETIDTTNWLPKVMRKDYTVGLTGQGSGVDPDLSLNLAYRCGGELNYNGYCSPEVDKLIDQQSIEADTLKRKKLVWEIERKLAEDGARPIIFYDRRATCRQPYVKGWTTMVNSIFNGWRMEDVWLDK